MKKKVYIAGKISGDPDYKNKFKKAAEGLERLGYIPLNPADHPENMSAADYMRLSFAMIDISDAVYFLPDWVNSKGARVEFNYCVYIGKKIVYHSNGGIFRTWK